MATDSSQQNKSKTADVASEIVEMKEIPEFELESKSYFTIHFWNGMKNYVLHLNSKNDYEHYMFIDKERWYLFLNNTEAKINKSKNKAIKRFGPIIAEGVIRDSGDDTHVFPLDTIGKFFQVRIPHTKQSTGIDNGKFFWDEVYDDPWKALVGRLIAEIQRTDITMQSILKL